MTPAPDDPGGPVLIVSAHPDDEVLAIGAWLASQGGRVLRFVTVTDGEASHPGSPTLGPDRLRQRRALEIRRALDRLGHDQAPIYRLRLPDGHLQKRHDELTSRLDGFITGAALVLAPYRYDGHPDHDATGAAAAEICDGRVPLWEFPVWAPVWDTATDLAQDPRARFLPSSSADRAAKAEAITFFETQIRPLSPHPADRVIIEETLLGRALEAPELVLT